MGHAMGQGDSMTFARHAEFHSMLIQVAGNRMLEHLSGIVSAALQVSALPVTGCYRPSETSMAHHIRILEALATGDGAAAEAAMRQLLIVHPEVERVVPAPREHDRPAAGGTVMEACPVPAWARPALPVCRRTPPTPQGTGGVRRHGPAA